MFFGLEVKSKEKLSKPITLTNSVQLSQAVLLPQGANKQPVCLVVEHDKKEFVLCVLDPSKSWQCPLNLLFESGSQVRFFLRGAGTVHLTGYESFDDLDDISMSMSEDDEEITSESDEEDLNKLMTKKSPKAKTNGHKSPNKNKEANNEHLNGNDDDDDDDESDLDFEDSDLDEDDDDQSDDDTDSDDAPEDPKTKRQVRRISAQDLKRMEDAMSDDDSGSEFEVDDDSDDY